MLILIIILINIFNLLKYIRNNCDFLLNFVDCNLLNAFNTYRGDVARKLGFSGFVNSKIISFSARLISFICQSCLSVFSS